MLKDFSKYLSFVFASPNAKAPSKANKLPLSSENLEDLRFTRTTPEKISNAPKNWLPVKNSCKSNDEASTVKKALVAKTIVNFEASVCFSDLKINTLEKA